MNATELFLADGRNAGIYFCADVDRKTYRTVCPPCEKAKREAAEKARFAAAEKVTSLDGYIMAEGYGYSDGYFPAVDDLFGLEELKRRLKSSTRLMARWCRGIRITSEHCLSINRTKQWSNPHSIKRHDANHRPATLSVRRSPTGC